MLGEQSPSPPRAEAWICPGGGRQGTTADCSRRPDRPRGAEFSTELRPGGCILEGPRGLGDRTYPPMHRSGLGPKAALSPCGSSAPHTHFREVLRLVSPWPWPPLCGSCLDPTLGKTCAGATAGLEGNPTSLPTQRGGQHFPASCPHSRLQWEAGAAHGAARRHLQPGLAPQLSPGHQLQLVHPG